MIRAIVLAVSSWCPMLVWAQTPAAVPLITRSDAELAQQNQAKSFNLSDWTAVAEAGKYLNSVTYQAGTFLAVGRGVILSSAEGTRWLANTNLPDRLTSATYGNGTFVVVGDQGTILTSGDSHNWRQQVSGTDAPLSGVAYGNGIFVAVGDYDLGGQTILTSPDGRNWQRQNPVNNLPLLSVTFAAGRFMAVGGPSDWRAGGVVISSTDGISWTAVLTKTSLELWSVSYGNGTFVAVGATDIGGGAKVARAFRSIDGVNWTDGTPGGNGWLRGVTYSDGLFIAAGHTADRSVPGSTTISEGLIFTSADGLTWTERDRRPGVFHTGITATNGVVIATGVAGTILKSGTFTPPEPIFALREFVRNDDGTVQMSVLAQTNTVVSIEMSSDLTNWSPLATKTNNAGFLNFTDEGTRSLSLRYYRIKTIDPD
jgi:hypothetical protein